MDISYSATAEARTCWRKYYFRHVMGLRPKKTSTALTIGSAIHEAFEQYFLKITTKEDITKYITDMFNTLISSEMDPIDVEKLTIAKYTVLGMWENYPLSEMEFEEIEPEKEFRVRIGKTRGLYLIGRVDGLVKKEGKWWVREVKTTSSDRKSFQQRASVSYQGGGYILGMGKQEGIEICGVVYDTIKKPLLRKGVYETTQEYAERIFKDYADPKKKELYYDRHYSYRTRWEIEEMERDLEKLAREIRCRTKHNDWHRNTDACYHFGSECPYKRICWDKNTSKEVLELFYTKRGE